MVLRDQIGVANSCTLKKVDFKKLLLIHTCVARSRPSQLWASGRREDVPDRDCRDEQMGASHFNLVTPLRWGGWDRGWQKKLMLLRACKFEVTLRSNLFRVCGLSERWNAYRIAVLLIAFLMGFADRN